VHADDRSTRTPPILFLSLHANQPTRRLVSALSAAFVIAAIAVALAAPSQTIARSQTLRSGHSSACSASTTRSRAASTVHACIQSSHKRKRPAHRSRKAHPKRGHTKKGSRSKTPNGPALLPASCEDGDAPVRGAGGSFSCRDGSEPECEDGATPTRSRGGAKLLCPALAEEGPESGEAECEEGTGSSCGAEMPQGSSEHECQTSPGESSSFACEDEG
jgi:hypothetical protein